MKYLIFSNKNAADARNIAEADARGCQTPTTEYWWDSATHPTDGRVALMTEDPPHSLYTGDQYNLPYEETCLVDTLDESWPPPTGE
jgi:hypothetical protein